MSGAKHQIVISLGKHWTFKCELSMKMFNILYQLINHKTKMQSQKRIEN